MDTVTPAKRSYVMSRVKGRDTSPERIVRRLVYHAGYRYRLCDPRLPGKPDLVFGENVNLSSCMVAFGMVMRDVDVIVCPNQIRNIGLLSWKKQSQRFSAFIKTTRNGLAGTGSLGVRT